MILTYNVLKYPQIDAAFNYIFDNPKKYNFRLRSNYPLTDIYEFGVYNGSSLTKICNYVRENKQILGGIPIHVHGFDSFEGLPKEENTVTFSKFKEGSYTSELTPENIEKS